MMGVGIVSGIVLIVINQGRTGRALPWTDPVVVSTLLMFGWLLASSGVGMAYRPAREGRKVAYLTILSFVFLVIALWSVLSNGTRHLGRPNQDAKPAGTSAALLPFDRSTGASSLFDRLPEGGVCQAFQPDIRAIVRPETLNSGAFRDLRGRPNREEAPVHPCTSLARGGPA
jgi:hypothetical protein